MFTIAERPISPITRYFMIFGLVLTAILEPILEPIPIPRIVGTATKGSTAPLENLRIKTDEKLEEKFSKIKEELGLNSNAEVVRFLIHKYYKELIGKGSLVILPSFKILPKLMDVASADLPIWDTVGFLAKIGINL